MKLDMRSHAPEEWLERYSMRRLTEEESDTLEDHLIFCQCCQDKLESVESFQLVSRMACRRVRQEDLHAQTSSSIWSRLRGFSLTSLFDRNRSPSWFPLPASAAAMACLALFLLIPRSQDTGYQQVRLQAVRGELAHSVNSRQPLELVLSLDGLPPSRSYRIEIVGATGGTTASKLAEPEGNVIAVRMKSKMPPGQYWVRLYLPGTNEPLQEFSLRSH